MPSKHSFSFKPHNSEGSCYGPAKDRTVIIMMFHLISRLQFCDVGYAGGGPGGHRGTLERTSVDALSAGSGTSSMDHNAVKRFLAGTYQFPADFVLVRSRPTVADLFKPGRRCGIYVLRFADGQYYVGQAIDVTRRYVQHANAFGDIEEMSFRCFPQGDLNRVEQEMVQALEEQQVHLRNVLLTSLPKGDSDLDLVVPRTAQEQWLARSNTFELQAQTLEDPFQRQKYTHRFSRLLKHPRRDEQVCEFLREYLSRCILQPAGTERSFWALTCLTKAGYFVGASDMALFRISVFWADALSVWFKPDDKDLRYSFRATKSCLPTPVKRALKVKSLRTYPITGSARGGTDQLYVEVDGVENAFKLLRDDRFVTAVKTFNLRNMRMGATSYSRNHCMDLAQYILAAGWRS
jgi:hypothetical protein